MKRYLLVTFFVVAACSTSQFTYYTAYEDEEPWRITVESHPIETFECFINDSSVIKGNFTAFIGGYDSFEKDAPYEGKMVKMSGFRIANESTDANGVKTTTYAYQIRIFIDKEEIAIFNF